MTREIAVEYARKGVRCNALCPGPIDTPLLAELLSDPERRQRRFVHIPMGRLGRAGRAREGGAVPRERRLELHDGRLADRRRRDHGRLRDARGLTGAARLDAVALAVGEPTPRLRAEGSDRRPAPPRRAASLLLMRWASDSVCACPRSLVGGHALGRCSSTRSTDACRVSLLTTARRSSRRASFGIVALRRTAERHLRQLARRFDSQTRLWLDTAIGPHGRPREGGCQPCLNGTRLGHLPRSRSGLLREARSATSCGRVVALGARRRGRHLRRLLRLELRPRCRRIRRPPDRDGVIIAVMYYGLVLLHRRDVAGPPAHGRRLFVRPIGDGPVGRVPHRPRREHGVRHHAGRRGRRDRVC